ncbi:MAG TPA: DoxX family protein [Solirubrobacteraceae bacterium]|jgi:putative oxidoreductase|nr:DoxX family protein [Solirubrobacteraceae bacterium]
MTPGSAAIRGVVGPLFVGHGTQKLFGWFGGHGRDGTAAFFESIGLRPGRRHATAAGVAETLGGALLTLGRLTPLASAALSGTMVTAIRKAHARNGPWATNGGYEYNLALLAALFAVTERESGAPWALAQLAAGAAGSFLVTSPLLTERGPAPSEGHAPDAGDPATEGAEPRFHRDEDAEAAALRPSDAASTGRS